MEQRDEARAALDEANRARGEIGPIKARIGELNAALDRSERETSRAALMADERRDLATRQAEEIATLRATVARLESDARDYEETIAANRRDYETLAEALRERIAGLESERAAMGAAMVPFARVVDSIPPLMPDGDWVARLTVGDFRACQPHALESAAEVLRAAREAFKWHAPCDRGALYDTCDLCAAVARLDEESK